MVNVYTYLPDLILPRLLGKIIQRKNRCIQNRLISF